MMKKFKPFELLTERIRLRGAERESTYERTTHSPTRAASAESVHSFKRKPDFTMAMLKII